jgi:hypothetical protein
VSDSSISLSPTSVLLGGASSGVGESIGALPYLYGGKFCRPVRSKDISVLGEELLQFSGFSVTQFCLAAAFTSCNFGAASRTCSFCSSGLVTSVSGSQWATGDPFVSWSRLVELRTFHVYLLAVLSCPSGAWASGLASTKPFSTPMGLSDPFPLPRIMQASPDHWPLPGWKARAPPRGSIKIPLPLRDAAFGTLDPWIYACRMSIPKINSFVILATNTQNSVGAAPESVSGKFPSRWGGLRQIPSAACSVGSTVLRAMRRRCRAWRQSHTPQCRRSRSMVYYRPSPV